MRTICLPLPFYKQATGWKAIVLFTPHIYDLVYAHAHTPAQRSSATELAIEQRYKTSKIHEHQEHVSYRYWKRTTPIGYPTRSDPNPAWSRRSALVDVVYEGRGQAKEAVAKVLPLRPSSTFVRFWEASIGWRPLFGLACARLCELSYYPALLPLVGVATLVRKEAAVCSDR